MDMKRKLFMVIAAMLMSKPSFAGTLLVEVSGMVCGFCARGIETILQKEDSVQNIRVDLTKRLVTIEEKPGANVSDERATEIIQSAGYHVKKIERK
jgi:copper chaperone CopZ